MKISPEKAILLILIIFISLSLMPGCPAQVGQEPDYWPTEGWRTATPESQGMDSSLLLNMMEVIWERGIKIDSVTVVRNGYIVLDAYGYPRIAKDEPPIHSCSKSITSALIGIAIDQGFINGVDQPILEFFPDRVAENLDANKMAMTLENVLTMATGLECRDSFHYNWRGLNEMKASDDWVQFMIDLPMAEAPGTRFEYCNGATYLLSAILQKQTGMNALSFAEKHLFGPLGVSDIRWEENSEGVSHGYGGVWMMPHDMAKFGYLYLNNGVWDGRRIISAKWIKASTRKHVLPTQPGSLSGYGYQWWTTDSGDFTAIGYGGQYIFVVPDKKLVVVFTSSLYNEGPHIPMGFLYSNILPSIQSDQSLLDNPDSQKTINSLVALWGKTKPADRNKAGYKARTRTPDQLLGEYVNKQYGFSARYDPNLKLDDDDIEPPVIFRKKAEGGIPMFGVTVDNIPQSVFLKDTGTYIIKLYREHPVINDPEIRNQKLIVLSDGTPANYLEITWRYQSFEMLTVTVIAYKKEKMIAVGAVGFEEVPTEYLAGMAKSLKFN